MFLVLHWLRSFGQQCFLRFGLHCATHQIRVILISCVVITSLFYPALAIYSSSQHLSLSLLDAFVTRNSASGFHTHSDPIDIWSGYDALKVHRDAVSRVKCGAARALRVERLLVQNPVVGDAEAINQYLLFILALEEQLNNNLSAGDHPCLKRDDGRCFVISPSLFWNNDKDALVSDSNVLKTLGASNNVTIDGITITPSMVLAGRESSEHRAASSTFTFAALTYFFPESDCLSTLQHSLWKQAVQTALSHDADVSFQLQEPSLIALEYDPDHSRGMAGTGLATFINLAYLGFFVYVAWSVRRMDAVHSRLGVTFTALVEIAVSTITSLSVCALVGFRITMVPWELLPIVIVFVGAENMFNLVDAVGRTSVTLSVKQRVAEGLSRAGTSNTLKVVTYNSILGLIAFFSGGAVRQFCVFAIVVLVAHWFLAHTFFVTVLSIDIQRLELEELLRHDPTVVPNTHKKSETIESLPTTRWRRLIKSVQALLTGRAATNISLLMLLAITATLYYMTYFSSSSAHDAQLHNFSATTRPWVKSSVSTVSAHYTTPWNIWRKLNPSQQPLLHLRIEKPALVTISLDPDLPSRLRDTRYFGSRPYIRLVIWLLKIMVLPIAGTTSMLWFLLLYLLKDAELLEAQRNRDGPDSANFDTGTNGFEGRISFSALPRAFTSDVELITSSQNGQTVLAVGLNNEIMVWLAGPSSLVTIDLEESFPTITLSPASRVVTSIVVDERGQYFAAGTGTGDIAVWNIDNNTIRFFHFLHLDEITAKVVDLRCFTPSIALEKPPPPDSSTQAHTIHRHAMVIAAFDNGSVIKWVLQDTPVWSWLAPARTTPVSKALISSTIPDGTLVVAFAFTDGCVELVEAQKSEPSSGINGCFQVGTHAIAEVHVCRLKLRNSARSVMAVTTESGKVSLWDLSSQEMICEIGCNGKPKQPRVIQGHREPCRTCGHPPLDNLFIAFAVEHDVKFYQLLLHDQIRYCTCSSNLRRRSSYENINRSSRGDTTALQPHDALRPRGLPAGESNSFPISGHGIYPRRASESTRRSSEILMVPFPGEDYESIHILGTNVLKPRAGSNSFWRNHSLVHLMDIPYGNGKWDLASREFFGVRRKERLKQQNTNASDGQCPSTNGLSCSTLSRWEIWTFDPATLRLQTSLLSAITPKIVIPSSSQASHIPRMPFTRVSRLVVTSSYALVGFGNTIGYFTFSDA